MQMKTPPPLPSVVKREDKMETVRTFIQASLLTPRAANAGEIRDITLVARSAESPVARALAALGETGRSYFKLLAAGGRSIHRETTRLVLLVELFGPQVIGTDGDLDRGRIASEVFADAERRKAHARPCATKSPEFPMVSPRKSLFC